MSRRGGFLPAEAYRRAADRNGVGAALAELDRRLKTLRRWLAWALAGPWP